VLSHSNHHPYLISLSFFFGKIPSFFRLASFFSLSSWKDSIFCGVCFENLGSKQLKVIHIECSKLYVVFDIVFDILCFNMDSINHWFYKSNYVSEASHLKKKSDS